MLSVLLLESAVICGQQVYDDFEGNSFVNYDSRRSGILRSVKNPAPDSVNPSKKCAKYIRSRTQYDNVKFEMPKALAGLEQYASYEQPRVIKMKFYTTAPVGTLIEIQLGKSAGNPYPEGTHSQYLAHTTKSGQWEEIEFKFAETPKGSKTKATDVNQLTILFNPNSNDKSVYYFDEVMGPEFGEATAAKHRRKLLDLEK